VIKRKGDLSRRPRTWLQAVLFWDEFAGELPHVPVDGPVLAFDVVTETLSKTTLGDLAPGRKVNLEGALRVGDRLSGHFVMGHVDGVGEVVSRADEPGQTVFRIRAPASVTEYLLEKGSIAVNGISLTIWDVAGPEFSIAVIPHTLSATTLSGARRGDRVNLEADVLARWIARMMPDRESRGGLSMEKLRDAGYDVDGFTGYGADG